jgi:hypothetical protein
VSSSVPWWFGQISLLIRNVCCRNDAFSSPRRYGAGRLAGVLFHHRSAGAFQRVPLPQVPCRRDFDQSYLL